MPPLARAAAALLSAVLACTLAAAPAVARIHGVRPAHRARPAHRVHGPACLVHAPRGRARIRGHRARIVHGARCARRAHVSRTRARTARTPFAVRAPIARAAGGPLGRPAPPAPPALVAPSPLRATAAGPYALALGWPAVPGATAYEIRLGTTLIDRLPGAATPAYTVRELWPQTTYPLTVTALDATGAPLASLTTTGTTAVASGAFPRLYSPSAFINTAIAAPALDPASSATVAAAITPYAASANLSDDDAWGIPIVSADAQSPSFDVACQYYWCQNDFGALPIPAGAQPNTGSDGHLVVLEPSGSELDMWIGQHTAGGWSAGERWVEPSNGSGANCATAWGCGAADAAGFALAAGVVRPEEIAQGHIDHALIITTPDTRQGYVACPAISGDGRHTSPTALPIGSHVQLDPSLDVAALPIPAWQKVIAVALQRYGAYVGDTGGSLEVRAESNLGRGYDAWQRAGVPATAPSLADLPWSSLRVLSMTRCA